MSGFTRHALTLGITIALTAVLAMPVCNLIYNCGCTWPFLGGEAHCNMHNPRPPHCPACRGDVKAQSTLVAVVALPVFGVVHIAQGFVRKRKSR